MVILDKKQVEKKVEEYKSNNKIKITSPDNRGSAYYFENADHILS